MSLDLRSPRLIQAKSPIMSTSARSFFGEHVTTAPKEERRKSSRHRAAFRRCCIVRDGDSALGLMRNFSSNGAQIETDLKVSVGDEISYFWEVRSCERARVVWIKRNVIGLEHVPADAPLKSSPYPKRELRIACEAQAQCMLAGKSVPVTVENISAQGICVRGLPALDRKTRVQIELGGRKLPPAKLCWQSEGSTGFSLSARVSVKDLARLLTDRRVRLIQTSKKESEDRA